MPAPAAAAPAEVPATSPLNLSCPPAQQPAAPGRFTLKIPSVAGAAPPADDNGTDGSPRLESDEGERRHGVRTHVEIGVGPSHQLGWLEVGLLKIKACLVYTNHTVEL